MLSRICVALIVASAIGSVSAETVIVRNVHGVTPVQQKGLQEFSVMVIEDGRVKQLTDKVDTASAKGATFIDGGGKYVLPGLTDAHGHVLGLGELQLQADWPAGVPAGVQIWLQAWVADAAASYGLAASNGVTAVTP